MIERIAEKLAGRTRWFDIIEVNGTGTPITFMNNRLYSITERQNSGCGVRVNVNGKTGFSYTNDSSRADRTAERALELSSLGEAEELELPASARRTFEPYDRAIESFDAGREIGAARETIGELRKIFPGATFDCEISASTGATRIINSRGVDASYRSSRYSVSLSASLVRDDGAKVEVWESLSSLAPVPYGQLRSTITDRLEKARREEKLPSGRVPVIMTPKAFSRLIGIVIAGLNAKSVWKGISPFAGRIGETAFNPTLTVTDDPEQSRSPNGYPFDDEAVTAVKKNLIDRGRIETYITDLKYAALLGMVPGGNGARGYSSLPYPSSSALVIGNGRESSETLLKNMGRGILVDQFIGLGQSNTLTGEFSANLDLAYLVEGGEITGRVKDCMLSGNIFTLLAGEVLFSAERQQTGSILSPHVFFPAVNYTG